jgi:hypothetical protein
MTTERWELDKFLQLEENHLHCVITAYWEFLKSARKEDLIKLVKAIEFDWNYFNNIPYDFNTIENDSHISGNENRFNFHIDEVGVYWYVCDNTKKDDDKIILELDSKYTAKEVCEVLNELNQQIRLITKLLLDKSREYKQFQQILDDMITTERTHIGKNVLIQFKEAIQ